MHIQRVPFLINGVTVNTEKIKYIFLSSNVMENRIRPGNENSIFKISVWSLLVYIVYTC